jgi:hypothetical protein
MLITKAIFDKMDPGEIFRVVITKYQAIHEPKKLTLKFVCIKGRSGMDWAIYSGYEETPATVIAKIGQKVFNPENAQSIAGCDDEVLALYRP